MAARKVAPFTGAWIETSPRNKYAVPHAVAPFTGAWIETHNNPLNHQAYSRRPLHGGVD